MNPLDREDAKCAEPAPWTVAAFRRSRRETWKATRVWLLLLAIAAIVFWTPFWLNRDRVHVMDTSRGTRYTLSSEDETKGEFTLGLVSLILGGVAGAGIVFGVLRHYRCPRRTPAQQPLPSRFMNCRWPDRTRRVVECGPAADMKARDQADMSSQR